MLSVELDKVFCQLVGSGQLTFQDCSFSVPKPCGSDSETSRHLQSGDKVCLHLFAASQTLSLLK